MLTKAEEAKMAAEHAAKYDALIEQCGGLEALRRLMPCDLNRVRDCLAAGDEHLNRIPLYKWDRAAGCVGDPNGDFKLSSTGPLAKRGLTLGERVCVLKQAARRLAAPNNEPKKGT